jgi:hypothetical protein
MFNKFNKNLQLLNDEAKMVSGMRACSNSENIGLYRPIHLTPREEAICQEVLNTQPRLNVFTMLRIH